MLGTEMLISELMKQVDNESIFFEQSGGGITFSGGEPLLHSDYLLAALKACGENNYHRVVDTSALAKEETLLEVAQHTEMFLIDLKVMDSEKHKKHTGVDNEKILSNIVALAKTDSEIIFRIPLMKGINTDKENIEKTAKFINALEGNRKKVNLLPYHNIAENKYKKLGNSNNFEPFETPDDVELQEIIQLFQNFQLEASIGG